MISSPESLGANHSYPDEADGEMDIRAVVAKLLARKWWIVASVVVFTAAFIAAAMLLTPIYRATTVLIPAKTDKDLDSGGGALGGGGGIGSVASLVGINLGGGDSATEEAIGVLKSRQFTDKFISDLTGGLNLWTGPINLQDKTVYLKDGEVATQQQIWYVPQLLEGMTGASK